MKLIQVTLALAALLSTAAAQGLGGLPACAVCCCLCPILENLPTDELDRVGRMCNQLNSSELWH
jgi:hypothetical protein